MFRSSDFDGPGNCEARHGVRVVSADRVVGLANSASPEEPARRAKREFWVI